MDKQAAFIIPPKYEPDVSPIGPPKVAPEADLPPRIRKIAAFLDQFKKSWVNLRLNSHILKSSENGLDIH
ncbi:MAG: hypothetical protein ACRD2B_14335 [Terriglobia bacterium]